VKLLRALQNGEDPAPGQKETIRVDVRVIAAHEPDIRRRWAEGNLARISTTGSTLFHYRAPPLRERREDIPLLANCSGEVRPAVREARERVRAGRPR